MSRRALLRLITRALCCAFSLAAVPALAADRDHQREQFRHALEDARKGQPWKALAADLADYPLLPWLEQITLLRHLDKLDRADADAFAKRWPGSLAAADLHVAFLKELARRQQWQAFLAEYDNETGRELQCHALHARIVDGQKLDWDKDFATLWTATAALPDACDAALAWAHNRGLIDAARLWQRIDLARNAGNGGLIDQLAASLPPADKVAAQRSASVLRDPVPTLKLAATWPDDAHHRDAVIGGMSRLARRNADDAEALWPGLKKHFHFSAADLGRVDAALALNHATEFDTDAIAQLAALPAEAQDDATREWRVRAALASGDWNAALDGLDALSETQKADNEWRYLRARVLTKLNRKEEAQPILTALAGEATFFGFLAADWLGQSYAICPLTLAADPKAEQELLDASPELARAFEWQAIDHLPEARRAWDFAMLKLDTNQRRLAADLSYRRDWFDRAVFSLTKGDELKLYTQRFPLARETQVKRESQVSGIDPAWAYAIIRAESAWVADARSAADAYGLMQLLPGTAAGLAKAEKIPYQRAQDLFQPSTNIALGTRYLSKMAQRYSGAPWLASAAYNAGPAPVDRWLTARGSLDPDFFVATIPYRETREYVARVMAFSVIYDWRMHARTQALAARMPRYGDAYAPPADYAPRKAGACPALAGNGGAAASPTAAAAH